MWIPSDDTASLTREPARRIEELREAARDCRACPLWEINTQTVFGEGPVEAGLVFIGEAPGAQEDAQGKPFVGTAGQLFLQALAAAGMDRTEAYITNTVKHRPWVRTAGRGKNRPPKQSEVNACHPWLEQELDALRPGVACCLGAVAARAVLGKAFRLSVQRGTWQHTETLPNVLATVHPSFVLIQAQADRERWRDVFFADVQAAVDRARSIRGG